MLRHVYVTSLLTSYGADIIKCIGLMAHQYVKKTLIYKHALIDPKADQEEADDVAELYGINTGIKPTTPADTNVVKFKKASGWSRKPTHTVSATFTIALAPFRSLWRSIYFRRF